MQLNKTNIIESLIANIIFSLMVWVYLKQNSGFTQF